MEIKGVLVFSNLNVAVFSDEAQQIPELQAGLLELLAAHFEKHGYDPEGLVIETQWGASWKLFKTTEGEWSSEIHTRRHKVHTL